MSRSSATQVPTNDGPARNNCLATENNILRSRDGRFSRDFVSRVLYFKSELLYLALILDEAYCFYVLCLEVWDGRQQRHRGSHSKKRKSWKRSKYCDNPITGRCMPGSGVDPELVLFR